MHRIMQRGDTIIEVMLAFVVFALLAIGAISIMNQGVSSAQRALEVTLVRQQLDAQADALRYVHDLANTEDSATLYPQARNDWLQIARTDADTSTSAFALQNNATECPAIPSDAFIMNARAGTLHDDPGVSIEPAETAPFSEVIYSSSETDPDTIEGISGIWIESKKVSASQKYVDFHIRACWYAAGGKPAIIGTIVRMYDAVE